MAFRLLVRVNVNRFGHSRNKFDFRLPSQQVGFLSTYMINKNIELMSNDRFVPSKSHKVFKDDSKPMIVLLTWLLARKKHVMKYCDVYLKQGCNVMTVSITPWQFFWPLTGSQVVAKQLLDYLEENCERQKQIVLHGFSVGAYLWGEVLVRMNSDLPRYRPLIDCIKGQVWDSAADISEISKGLPAAMFPKNAFLRSTIEKYVHYHLKTFYDVATQHYVRSSQLFHTTPVHAPTLVFVSKNDPIGSVVANESCKESWESIGMKVCWQCWEKSRHVSHLILHRDVYLKTLYAFLTEVLEGQDELSLKMCNKI